MAANIWGDAFDDVDAESAETVEIPIAVSWLLEEHTEHESTGGGMPAERSDCDEVEDDLLALIPLPSIDLEQPAKVDNQSEVASSPLSGISAVASYLQCALARYPGKLVSHAGKEMNIDRKLLRTQLGAVSEVSVSVPPQMLSSLVKYIASMKGRTLVPVAFVERQAYDETPSLLRVPELDGGHEERKVKLFMLETEYAILFRKVVPHASDLTSEDFCAVRIPFHGAMRLAERNTAENVVNVVQSAVKPSDTIHLGALFDGNLFRIAETDEHPSNMKAERILPSLREEGWSNGTLHSVCIGHKVHKAAESTWSYIDSTITGVIHTYKTLSDQQSITAVRKALRSVLTRQLDIIAVPSVEGILSELAVDFRAKCLHLFLPPPSQPQNRELVIYVAKRLLNGNWLNRGRVEHYCIPGCCGSHACTVSKLTKLVPKAIFSMRAHCFARNNWLQWDLQLNYFAWSWVWHGANLSAMLQVFTGLKEKDTNTNDLVLAPVQAELEDAGAVPVNAAAQLGPNELDEAEVIRLQRARSLRISIEFLQLGSTTLPVWHCMDKQS
eukprot:2480580-Amphidinium_carterae.1